MLRQTAIIHRFQFRPVLYLNANDILQPKRCQFERSSSPAANTQRSIVEFIRKYPFVFVQFQDIRPAPSKLPLFQGFFYPFPPSIGITKVSRQDRWQRHPGRPDSDAGKELFQKRGQGVIVGSEAPADTEFSARLSGRIGQDLDCQRIGGRWKIDEAGEKFALIHFAIDNNEYPVYSSLGMKFRQGGSNLLHVFDGVEVPGMGPKDDHGFTVTGDASKLCPNVQVLVCVLILDVTVITEKDFRKRDSQE
mmetsp:Transcript_5241/g.15241  ORF Transcript_5241/g.15241 Transcript_5241/m.15241 type:complete len:249 (-) Transcript_5241:282-1028(-)